MTSDKELAAKLRDAILLFEAEKPHPELGGPFNVEIGLGTARLIVATLESKSSTKDESFEALEVAVDKLPRWVNAKEASDLIELGAVRRLIADAKEQGEPKETRATK